MKKSLRLLRTYSIVLFSSTILGIGSAQAQVTTLVSPGENTIATAVAAAGANDTLVLARGEDYTVTEVVLVDKALTIRSSPGLETDRPAVMFFTSTVGEGGGFFNCAANLTIKDIGMVGKTTGNKPVEPFNITSPNLKVVMDGVIVQDCHQTFEAIDNSTVVIKNCKFFNQSWSLYDNWVGQMAGWDGDNVYLTLENNTIFTYNRYFNYSTTKNNGTTLADHNTIVNTFGNTMFPSPDKEVTVKNGIFFNSFYRGYIGARTFIIGTDSIVVTKADVNDNELSSRPYIPATDTLNGDIAIIINPLDSTSGRIVSITNNLKFTEKRVLDFQAANGVTLQPLVNKTAKEVLAPQFHWTIKDNLEGVQGFDPKFKMGALPAEAFTAGFQTRLDRISPANEPWFDITWRYGGALVGEFIWPLPFDFTPTVKTEHLSADGFPLGDLNWFGKDVVANWEKGGIYVGLHKLNSSELGLKINGNIISYNNVKSGKVTLKIYNAAGAEVTTLVNQVQSAGSQTVYLPSNLRSGVYICKVQAGEQVQAVKTVIVK